MSTLFDSTKPVKPSPAFGRGILPARAECRNVPTQADRDWWAQESNQGATDYEVEPARNWDDEAGAAAATDRMCAGIPLF